MWPKLVTIDMVAPNTTVPELPVRRASEDPHEVADATFKYGKVIGNRTVHIDTLKHGTSVSESPERVHHLAKQMSGPGGYISRPIVDDSGEVLEGQHRVAALKHLGVKKVPVTVVKNLARNHDEESLEKAARSVGGLHPDQVKGLVHNALEASHEEGGPDKVMSTHEFPRGFEKHYAAVFNAMKAKKETSSHILRVLTEIGNDPSKLFYIATYDRVREIFTANSEYDTFEAARKHLKDEDNEWIISPYRGKDFMYVAIQPKLPSLIWSFPLNKVEFAGQPNTWIKLR
jgi:ParB-like nuclease domain